MNAFHVSLGGNMGNVVSNFLCVLSSLIAENVRFSAISSLYLSEAVGCNDTQPDYYNAVIVCHTDILPHRFLSFLQALELILGRVRLDNGEKISRCIDCDIVLYDYHIIYESHLVIPHPECMKRAFVLLPLYEIDPAIGIAGHGRIESFLPAVEKQKIVRYYSSSIWASHY